MSGIKESVKVNVEGAIIGVEEKGFNFVNQFKAMAVWKQRLVLGLLIAIIPAFLIARLGTEQFYTQKYGRQALSAHPSFDIAQNPLLDEVTVIRNPNDTYSAVVQVTNPNLDLAATGISYTADFLDDAKQIIYKAPGTFYLLPNERKYLVFPRIVTNGKGIASASIKLGDVQWQKKLAIPEVKLRSTEPMLSDETNPLTFTVNVSVINESPYRVGTARTVTLLYDQSDRIIGVGQRDESALLPYGRREFKQFWPGIYKSQVKRVVVLPTTNLLDPNNITIDSTTNASTTQPL